ncbi:response regulator transcription factor [Segetibacter koreensis]|uniref:response regulator transcription factor n=1 Tax=Segetibacter koreensis TaxID=398037 RepID=UPI000380995A|nr:response regulator transcription factor [Segetibacter koreensis]
MERLIQLALADEIKIFRDGIRMAMKNRDYISIIWEAEDSKELTKKLKLKTPDVLLMDIRDPGANAIKDLQLIKKEYPDLKIIIFSMYDDYEIIREMMEYGANAYLTKRTDGDEIYKAILACMNDDFYFNELVNTAVLFKLQEKKSVKRYYPHPVKLNDKELKILKLISEDKTTEEISEEIFLSPRTVETIRQNMKTKVGAKTIAGLLMYGIRNKLLHP